MSNGANLDYKFGSKNNWRRTIWNALLRRTKGRERKYPILYLAGRMDLDRAVAESKGVPRENLIAVEKDRDAYLDLRRRGVPVIHGDLIDVLWSWSQNEPVAAVVADYCSGIVWRNAGLYDCFERAPLRGAEVVVNLLRGRDPYSNAIRGVLKAWGVTKIWKTSPHRGRGLPSDGQVQLHADAEKHRGAQFVAWHALESAYVAVLGAPSGLRLPSSGEEKYEVAIKLPRPGDDELAATLQALASLTLGQMGPPEFYSYRSASRQWMDSVIFHHAIGGVVEHMPGSAVSKWDAEVAEKEKAWGVPKLRRSIAAHLATRTRRLAA